MDDVEGMNGEPAGGADLAVAGAPPAPAGLRRRAALWAGMAAVVAATAFGLLFLAQSGPDTPEKAVERLLAAVADEDVLGVLEALPPSERGVLTELATDSVAELQRLGVLSDGASLSAVPGLDLGFEDLELSSEPVGDGVSIVRVRAGSGTYTVSPSSLPLGDLVRELMGDDLPDQTISGSEPLSSDLDRIATVREDGRWYVSLWYSMAESLRAEAGAPPPVFGAGSAARGEASPEAAVRALVEAALRLDARRAVELLDPVEARVVHDYAPLFLDAVEAAATGLRRGVSLSLDELETAVDRSDGRAAVVVTSLRVSGTAAGGAVTFHYDGECASFSGAGSPERLCDEDLSPLGPLFGSFLPGAEVEPVPALVAVERDGGWFLSPGRTLLGAVVDTLRRLDAGQLRAVLRGDTGGWYEGDGQEAEVVGPEGRAGEPGAVGPVPAPPVTSMEEFERLTPGQKEAVLRGQRGPDDGGGPAFDPDQPPPTIPLD